MDLDSSFIELVELLGREVVELSDDERRDDLYLRLAVFFMDFLDDHEAAARYLSECSLEHPDAFDFRKGLYLEGLDREGFRKLLEDIPRDNGELWVWRLVDLAGIHLFCLDDFEKAAEIAQEACQRNPEDKTAAGLALLALEVSGNRKKLIQHLGQIDLDDPNLFARSIFFSLTKEGRVGDWADILESCEDLKELPPFVIERFLELAFRKTPFGKSLGKSRLSTVLECKTRALEDVEGYEEELDAAMYLLGLSLKVEGDGEKATRILHSLSDSNPGWGRILALHTLRMIAVENGLLEELAGVYEKLASSVSGPWSFAYLLLAAECLEGNKPEANGKDDERLRQWAERIADSSLEDKAALGFLQRYFMIRGRYEQLVSIYESAASLHNCDEYLVWASLICESKLGDLRSAVKFRLNACSEGCHIQDFLELTRLRRKERDGRGLLKDYVSLAEQRLLEEEEDPQAKRSAALYYLMAGLWAQRGAKLVDAEKYLLRARELAPKDPMALMALSNLYSAMGRKKQQFEHLESLVDILCSKGVKINALRELATVSSAHLSRPDQARKCLERALELAPEDPSLYHDLAKVADHEKDYPKAMEFRRKAAEMFGSGYRSAVLWVEIGRILSQHIHDDEEAEKAFLTALDMDEGQVNALKELSGIYRRLERWAELLESLRLRLEMEPGDAAEVHMESAQIIMDRGFDGKKALGHLSALLDLQPDNESAMDKLEQLCRRDGMWEELVDRMNYIPRENRRVDSLMEALERLGRWEDLIQCLKNEVERNIDPRKAAEYARKLANLYEDKRGDLETAMKWYRRAFEADPEDLKSLRAYQNTLEEAGAYEKLERALREELLLCEDDKGRRLLVRKRLADLLDEKLHDVSGAARVLEEARLEAPDDWDTANRLVSVYERTGESEKLLKLLEARAANAFTVTEKVQTLLQAGRIQEKEGMDEQALMFFGMCFDLDAANRKAFTAVERLCYKLKRWKEALELYDKAIDFVEKQGERAYRLSDLYARRGQMQLQYLAQPGEAAASYLKVMELDPENSTSIKYLESIFSHEGDWSGLIKAYEKRAALLKDNDLRAETIRRAARVAAAKLQDIDDTARLYESLLELIPADSEALDALELYYERSRQWEKLLSKLHVRLEHATSASEKMALRLRMGRIWEDGINDVASAVEAYEKVLELDGENKEALDALGRIYEGTERWADMVDVTRRRIRITADRNSKALLYFKCGSVMEAKFGKSDDAIRYYKAAIKTSPTCLPAVHGLRDIFIRKEEWKRVLETLELEVKLWQEPRERAGVFAQIGNLFFEKLGDPVKARRYFESALSIDSECRPANLALFNMTFEEKDWSTAARMADLLGHKAMREGAPSERSEFYWKRGMVSLQTKSYADAVESFVVALEIAPNNMRALTALTSLCRSHPQIYDYASVFDELKKAYKSEKNKTAIAHVMSAEGSMKENSGDVEFAESLYVQSIELVGDDYSLMTPLVDLKVRFREWKESVKLLEDFVKKSGVPQNYRVGALLRAAEIQSEGAMDSRGAEKLYLRVLRMSQRNRVALYGLSQELVLQGRLDEALRKCCELIDAATDPDDTAPADELGRYYYYLGRIHDLMDDDRNAGLSYRRALELNPVYPPPAIALAERFAKSGDFGQGESLLSTTALSASDAGAVAESLKLRRVLARLHVEYGNRDAGMAELRSIVASDLGEVDDRLALGRLYAEKEGRAEDAEKELMAVVSEEPDNLLAIRQLALLWEREKKSVRLRRALEVLRLLGRLEDDERKTLETFPRKPMSEWKGTLSEDLTTHVLIGEQTRRPFDQLWAAVQRALAEVYPVMDVGRNPVPYTQIEDKQVVEDIVWVIRACGLASGADVFVAEKVPRQFVVLEKDGRVQVVLDRKVVEFGSDALRYTLARAFAFWKLGYVVLARLGPKERKETATLLLGIAAQESERAPTVKEFLNMLKRSELKAAERVAKAAGELMLEDNPLDWMKETDRLMDRLALVFADDLEQGLKTLSLIDGETMVLESGQSLALLYSVEGGWDLLKFYMSAGYDRLAEGLREVQEQLPE